MDGVKGVSLVEETPIIDPNLLFLYLEDLRKLMKDLKTKLKSGEKMKKKLRKHNETKIKHIKVLLKYLDEDYAETKKTLYPMLESGLITFDLLWALYKPVSLYYDYKFCNSTNKFLEYPSILSNLWYTGWTSGLQDRVRRKTM